MDEVDEKRVLIDTRFLIFALCLVIENKGTKENGY